MSIVKPFKRIYRPLLSGGSKEGYLTDSGFSADRQSYIYSYHLIEKDIKELFDYISPHNSNKSVFSHRIYELFFRACTEFENNAKAILVSNGYSSSNNLRMNDYFKINAALRLDGYETRLNVWEPSPLVIKPFASWNSSSYASLAWYQAYNNVKHGRTDNFSEASLENLIAAASGLLAVLYAQYAYNCFSPYSKIEMISEDDSFESVNDSLFELKRYEWGESDKYDFDWDVLKDDTSPYDMYSF